MENFCAIYNEKVPETMCQVSYFEEKLNVGLLLRGRKLSSVSVTIFVTRIFVTSSYIDKNRMCKRSTR